LNKYIQNAASGGQLCGTTNIVAVRRQMVNILPEVYHVYDIGDGLWCADCSTLGIGSARMFSWAVYNHSQCREI